MVLTLSLAAILEFIVMLLAILYVPRLSAFGVVGLSVSVVVLVAVIRMFV